MKFFRGAGRAARAYVEADHHRADDYYLAEGSGIAQLVEVRGATGEVSPVLGMDGPTYEKWVEGYDVLSDAPKGRLRTDGHALRFAEVVVNGPKSWSLAAGLHEDVSRAYDAAQQQACAEIGRFVAANASTRLGKRGEQVQVRVDAIEMAMVQHFTSRAGDPHRHIHLQFNARVPIGDRWRGIDSAALLRMQRAINGIGHRAVVSDSGFRRALAEHGYTLNDEGEIEQLAEVVPAMSKRTEQVARNVERYEREWRAEHPDAEPSAAQLRSWDRRGWEDARPDKTRKATSGGDCDAEWIAELRALGVDVDAQRQARPIAVQRVRPDRVDRAAVTARALAVLGSGARGRSSWNVYDARGAVEEVLAGLSVVGGQDELTELAQAVTDDVVEQSVSLVDQAVPEHVRHLTSEAVLARAREIDGRLAVRAGIGGAPALAAEVGAALARLEVDRGETLRLDEGQVEAARAIAGSQPLVFIEGAAGAGKTSVLSAANQIVTAQGGQLRVVAPTKKAALVAGDVIGTASSTAAGLAYAHGFRWDRDGVWRRLAVGDTDSTGATYQGPPTGSRLNAGDTLVVDEAGMLDQDTARALLRIADEADARIVFLGDRRQLPAVGVGGVLDLVAKWTPEPVELQSIHRFRRNIDVDGHQVNVADENFAALSLQMRSGINPGEVFDRLAEAGSVRLWDSEADALAHLAVTIVDRQQAGESQSVSVATNDTAALINEAAHDRLVDLGVVDAAVHAIGADGLPIGVGERVMTRRNDHQIGVANRQVWTVEAVNGDGAIDVVGVDGTRAQLPADYVHDHVQLAYATTVHGVQGETSTSCDELLTDASDAAAQYVGLTRGRHQRTVHIVAHTLSQAREQWIGAAGRNRADLGVDQARAVALQEARNYRVEQTMEPERPRSRGLAAIRRLRTTTTAMSVQQPVAAGPQPRARLAEQVLAAQQRNNVDVAPAVEAETVEQPLESGYIEVDDFTRSQRPVQRGPRQ